MAAAQVAIFLRDPFARAKSMRAYDEAMAGAREGIPAFAVGELEPQACYLAAGVPAFLGVLERLDADWPRLGDQGAAP